MPPRKPDTISPQTVGILVLVAIVGVIVYMAANSQSEARQDAADRSRSADPVSTSDFQGDDLEQSQDETTESSILEVDRPAKGPVRVVFAGDSLTYGLFASRESRGYRALTVEALSDGGRVDWTRGGQTGNKVKEVSDTITFASDTDLVVLELGTNDLYKTEVPTFTKQYAAFVNKVEDQAPDAALVCLGVWGNVDVNRNYDPSIEQPCVAAGGRFIALYDLFEDDTMRGPAGRDAFGGVSDDFHPNDKGYKAIADRLLNAIDVR